ncbi:MAG: hypothetical protein EXR54_10045 [Dehalococcoidia bacterium]|nr:hypothetical protein [Dehalococcoidia bacterium]MSQ17873.1 hypothetical protein [Dehalococcoidia bacterium]
MATERGGNFRRLQGYVNRSQHYLQNAYASLEQGEVEKAGEFLWGSMAQAIKAVATFRGLNLRSHDQIRAYASELSRAIGDTALRDAFRDANSLHQNFYESGLTREIVLEYGERIRHSVGRLLSLIPREALEA